MKKLIILMVISGSIIGCSGSEDGTGYKDLFSKWITSDNIELDLTNMEFDVAYDIRYYTHPNNGCDCTFLITGDQNEGTAYLSSCTHFGPTDYCTAGTRQYDYVSQGTTLEVCGFDGCEVWR